MVLRKISYPLFERLCCRSQPDESFVRVSLASFEILLLQSKRFHFRFITFNRHLTPSTRSSHRCDLLFIFEYKKVDYRRPTGTLWKGKMVIGKEALFVIMGLKRLNIGGQKLKRLKQTTDYCIQKSLRQEKKTCKRCSSFHNVL